MKPNFSLSLSFDGIRLLLRAAGGWQLVGAVDVADPDLAGALATLRAKADALRPGGLQTKLIIPDEQIRYLSVETGPLETAARQEAARLALEGATPYPVDALIVDVSADGATTHIAAVARETLAEAEAFATEHAFNPVSFVAAPLDAGFLGEPFFGPTVASAALLAEGDTVEADGVRVVIVGDAPARADTPEPESAPADQAPDPAKAAAPVKATQDTPAAAPNTPPPQQDSAAAPQNRTDDDQTTPPVVAAARPDPLDTLPTTDDRAAQSGTGSVPPPTAADSAAPTHDISRDATDTSARTPPPAPEPEQAALTTETDSTTSAADGGAAPAQGVNSPRVAPPKADPAREGAATLGFASRRGAKPSAAAALGGVTRKAPPAPNTAPNTAPVSAAASAPIAAPVQAPPPPKTPPQATVDSLRPIAPPIVPAASDPATVADPAPAGGGFLSRRKPPTVPDPARSATAGAAPSAAKVEARRMTVFGARDTAPVGGKPRYLGLILTAMLIVFMAGVAAWAAIFLDDGLARLFPARERTLASTLPEQTPALLAQEVGATTASPDAAAADAVEMASLEQDATGGLTSEDAAVLDALRDPLPDPLPDPPDAPEILDDDVLAARYAVTGIWPLAPDGVDPAPVISLDDLYITSIDPISPALDAVALPGGDSFQTDTQLAVVTSPVAAGTNFTLGPDGRVIATLEGALSPDGHTVFLGPPPLVPPATPVRFATTPTETGTLASTTQVRPRVRPTDLIEQNERATLGGLSRAELATLRPQLRPRTLQEQVEAQEQADAQNVASASALAAAQSLRPKTRPSGFAQLVARATPNLGSTAVTTRAAPAPASVAPRTVTPSIPSSASVSREATTRNALNLRKVNLIGVYGKPSDRRALVRLSNGRYRKVQVGDRIDGGRVSAIGDSELRYQKGSRNLVLKMPKG